MYSSYFHCVYLWFWPTGSHKASGKPTEKTTQNKDPAEKKGDKDGGESAWEVCMPWEVCMDGSLAR